MNLIRNYYQLTKPRVVALMLLTTLVGMLLTAPKDTSWSTELIALIGIGLTASAAAACNQLIEIYLDSLMNRTKNRPLPRQEITHRAGWFFATILAVIGLGLLYLKINFLTMWLTFATLIGYALIYTVFLKHATPQNIVIGGLAGATPPLLGAAAVTNQIPALALLLALIIFIWTPPHFWALAIHRRHDYSNANIPMLPVTHGVPYTKLQILFYTLLLCSISLLPFGAGFSGYLYLVSALILNACFLYYTIRLYRTPDHADAKYALATFKFSITYLGILFLVLVLDHYWYLG